LLITAATAAHSQILFSQGFDSVASLGGSGWAAADTSTPASALWFQGNPGIFSSQAGAPNSYIAANPFSTTGDSLTSVSNYLITPEFSLSQPTTLSFWTRSTGIADGFPDRLQVLLSTAGTSTVVGSFGFLLADLTTINDTWALSTINIGGLGASASGRIAFRYFIPDAANAGSYLGLDTVSVAAVPEPSVWASMVLGIGILSLAITRSRRVKGEA